MSLSASRSLICRQTQVKIMAELTIASASVCYVGAILCTNTSNQLVPAADSTAIRFAGICEPLSGVAMTGDGTLKCRVTSGYEVLLPCAGTVTAADRGAAIYAADDDSVTDATTLGPQIGTLVEMEDSTHCWVRLHAGVMADAT